VPECRIPGDQDDLSALGLSVRQQTDAGHRPLRDGHRVLYCSQESAISDALMADRLAESGFELGHRLDSAGDRGIAPHECAIHVQDQR
jgi:hypothetical protein